MAKLKFDRSINLNISKSECVTVPADEVWKASAHPAPEVKINGRAASLANDTTLPFGYILGGVLK